MSSIASTTGYSAATSGTATDTVAGAQQTLTQNNFLQLLVTQMENQDPMNPQSDTDMAAQMAQFTSLTQSSAMSASLSLLQANSLIGSTVSVTTDSKGDTTSGVVQSVRTGAASSSGNPEIIINGTAYELSSVISVTPPTAASTTSTSQTSN